MTGRQSRSEQRRHEILQAALNCFMHHGVEHTTIEMIRDASGASTGSLYHHFGNKEQLAARLFMQGLEDFSRQLQAALAKNPDARTGIRLMVTTYIDWVVANPDWAHFIFHTRHQVIRGEAAEQLRNRNRQQFQTVHDWLRPHIEAGQVREVPIELLHSVIIGPAQDYVRNWLAGRVTTSPLTYRDELADTAWLSLKASR